MSSIDGRKPTEGRSWNTALFSRRRRTSRPRRRRTIARTSGAIRSLAPSFEDGAKRTEPRPHKGSREGEGGADLGLCPRTAIRTGHPARHTQLATPSWPHRTRHGELAILGRWGPGVREREPHPHTSLR